MAVVVLDSKTYVGVAIFDLYDPDSWAQEICEDEPAAWKWLLEYVTTHWADTFITPAPDPMTRSDAHEWLNASTLVFRMYPPKEMYK